jgi:hypothetical protein
VKTLGALNSTVRTADETEIAFFWTDHVGMQYSRAFRALATARNLNVVDTTRLFAMLYTSGADAAIGCWDAKYHYSFWRPVTAIENGAIDGNPATVPDAGWQPITATPNHPEYPSAHSCVTGSVTTTLEHFFGTPNVTVVLSSSVTNTSRTFTRLGDWEREVEVARIYAGFHYHHSVIQGVGLGREVSKQLTQEYFQPVRHDRD